MALLARWNWRSDVRGFWALLQWELRNLARSWMLRLWLLLTAVISILLGAISSDASQEEAASQLFSAALSLYLTFGSIVFIVLSASSVASEREVVSDSILSRSVTRYH